MFLAKLKVNTIKNSTSAIPKTYTTIKRIIEGIEGVIPVIITTAREEAHGNMPVSKPTVMGFSIFESPKFP